MRLRSFLLAISVIIGLLIGTAGPAAAEYHYAATPTQVTHDGITFYLIIEYDAPSNHVRAEGRIVSASGQPGRINWIHLFRDYSAPRESAIVGNYAPAGGIATTTSRSGYAGPVVCQALQGTSIPNVYRNVYYWAEMSIHQDGTSWNYLLTTPFVSSPCYTA